MKLYTEEQVRKAMNNWNEYDDRSMSEIINSLTPIELPSDEEIEWINIKDELPPNNIWVLLYLPMYDNIAMGVGRDGEIDILGDFFGEPTHWRFLPKSPKEQILNQNK